jgi:hypothetical protein
MVVFIKQNDLYFGVPQAFGDLKSPKASTDNDDTGFAQVSNTRSRGN